jgi:hypothetical protein
MALEAEIGDRWRRQAEVTWPSDGSTWICYCVNIPRQVPAIYKLPALVQVAKTDRKRESVVGGAT